MSSTYDPWLVLLSLLIAAVAAYTTLELAKRVRTPDRALALGWWAMGSVSMGTGIWSMHFVGMLAFELPIEVGYDKSLTLISWFAAVGVSAIGLAVAAGQRLTKARLVGGALTMGAGICGMHYTGMAAMSMQPGIVWSWGMVGVSAVIAVAASAIALCIFFKRPEPSARHGAAWQAVASLVMAAGITGMHYTGMAAAGFPVNSVCTSTDGFRGDGLFVLIAGAAFLLLALTLFTAGMERRMAAHRDLLEREVSARTADLVKARDAALAADRAKTEFLAAISHELRTPLTSIRGFSELMEHRAKEPSIRMQAGLIRKGAEHLQNLLTEILDFAKIEAGAVAVANESTDLRALVQGTVDFFALTAQAKGLHLQCHFHPDSPQHLVCDSLRLKQILNNLLSNALKFTTQGSVTVQVQREGHMVALHVEDTGHGIAPEAQDLIFEKFRQAHARISHDHGGTGLGLALSRGLAGLMQGSLNVQSAIGVGSRFTLRLPIMADVTAPQQPVVQAEDAVHA